MFDDAARPRARARRVRDNVKRSRARREIRVAPEHADPRLPHHQRDDEHDDDLGEQAQAVEGGEEELVDHVGVARLVLVLVRLDDFDVGVDQLVKHGGGERAVPERASRALRRERDSRGTVSRELVSAG